MEEAPSTAWAWLSGNPVGELPVEMLSRGLESVVEKGLSPCLLLAVHGALRGSPNHENRHEIRHGELPGKLD